LKLGPKLKPKLHHLIELKLGIIFITEISLFVLYIWRYNLNKATVYRLTSTPTSNNVRVLTAVYTLSSTSTVDHARLQLLNS